MAKPAAHFSDFVLEQLAALHDVKSGRFFSGVGLSSGGTQFGFVMGSTLYFVVDASTRPKYESMGSRCFSYDTKTKRIDVRKYYEVPADTLEDPEQLVALARESLRIAFQLKTPAPGQKRKPKSKITQKNRKHDASSRPFINSLPKRPAKKKTAKNRTR